jgi:hypothetical protein
MSGENFICCGCLGDDYLIEEIEGTGENELCSYCGESGIGEILSRVAVRVDTAYKKYYRDGESIPIFYGDNDRLDYEQLGDSPEYIINSMIKSSDTNISDDICAYLAEDEEYGVVKDGANAFYNSAYCYKHVDEGGRLHYALWENFCEDIKHGARFFSLEAKSTLSQMFCGVNTYVSSKGETPIRLLPPCEIYRSRKANTIDDVETISSSPHTELDAPPKRVAKNGRLNALGIPIFYGAFDKNTCIAELKPAVGETIVCGIFSLSSPLKVFDFTVLNDVYKELSMFDSEYGEKLSQLAFLRSFEAIISRAFLPSESDLEYLPLQAMTEYLSRYVDGGVDGIIYPSAQSGGFTKNIVVFKNDNRVQVEDDCVIYKSDSEPFLTFQEGSVSVHMITAVSYSQEESSIERYLQDLKYCFRARF